MRVFVAGATGAIGRPLCSRLAEAGHDVVGTTRSESKLGLLERLGVAGAVCDALDRAAMVEAVERARPDVAVSQLTDLPERMGEAEDHLEANDRARNEGTLNLLAGAERVGARTIAQSIAWIYDPDRPGPAEEGEPVHPDPPAPFDASLERLLGMEGEVVAAGGLVLRYGFLYGPGTWFAPDGDAVSQLRKRMLPRVGGGEGVWSFVHVEDAAAATVAAIEAPAVDGVLNVCDDEPIPSAEWLPLLAEASGAPKPLPAPRFLARWIAGRYAVALMCEIRGVDNARAERELGWEPSRRTVREGFPELFARVEG